MSSKGSWKVCSQLLNITNTQNNIFHTDLVFRASQDIAMNAKMIAAEEATVKACEEELLKLKEIPNNNWITTSPTQVRAEYLYRKMMPSVRKIQQLEHDNSELKKLIVKA
jgi:hypothetical protein